MPRFPLLLVLVGCQAAESPYSYCKGDYEPRDADDDSVLGYSAQDALDRLGLDHTGNLGWLQTEWTEYDLPLPDQTSIAFDLAVDTIRWGTYRLDTGNLDLWVDCPEEGLEVLVSGTATLYDEALPVEGYILAERYEGGDFPALEALGLYVRSDLSQAQSAFLTPTLGAFAEGEGFEYDRADTSFLFGWNTWGAAADLQVSWVQPDAVADIALPFEPWIGFDN